MDTGQKTESLAQLVGDIDKNLVVLPEFQRDFVWEIEKTFDLFDSFVKDIFVGSLIYGIPSFEVTVRELDRRPRKGKGSRSKLKLTSFTKEEIEKRVKTHGFRLLLDGQQRATAIYRALKGVDSVYFIIKPENELSPEIREIPVGKRSLEQALCEFSGEPRRVSSTSSFRMSMIHSMESTLERRTRLIYFWQAPKLMELIKIMYLTVMSLLYILPI